MHTVHAPYRGYLESSWGMREQPRVRAGEAASSTTPFAGGVLGLLARMMEIDNRPASSSYMYLEHFRISRESMRYIVSKVPEDVVCKVRFLLQPTENVRTNVRKYDATTYRLQYSIAEVHKPLHYPVRLSGT